MRKLRLVAVVLAVPVLLLGGCGDEVGDGPPVPQSGVVGVVRWGPTCPVEREGEPCPPAHAGTATVSAALPGGAEASGEPVATVTTDDRGRFRMPLQPGDYTVTSDAGMSCTPRDVHVDAGGFTEIDLLCDTGIR